MNSADGSPEASGRATVKKQAFEGEAEELPVKALSRSEVQALLARQPTLSPWRVVRAQAVVGAGAAALGYALTQRQEMGWSALYGAACAVVPNALMARGMTSRLSSLSPSVSAVSFMLWEFGKIGVAVAMLALASRLGPLLSWPALLVALAICLNVHWVALLWRGQKTN
jgi:ATP synthase protein I